MRVLVIGGGGREHALVWKIKQSPLVEKVFEWKDKNISSLIGFIRALFIDFVVVGPDDALAAGVADDVEKAGVKVFGPTKAAAQIEWSKSFAKELMQEEGISTARFAVFSDRPSAKKYVESQTFPIVIKSDGLALGKGVVIAKDMTEAIAALPEGRVVIEEYMEGREISVHALSDGRNAILFPPSQDHKRAYDNDQGPNTGGMGAVVPVQSVTVAEMQAIKDTIVLPTLRALAKRGAPFKGLLFPGIMLTKDGPKVIEFNARFGDPEVQSYVRLMESDIVPALVAAADGDISNIELKWKDGAACTVVLASGGYPGAYKTGVSIAGIELAEKDQNVVVFEAGTKQSNGDLLTNGGRVLNVTATGPDLAAALKTAYAAVGKIHFAGMQYRKDIGQKAVGGGVY